jgi:hypothetical protein
LDKGYLSNYFQFEEHGFILDSVHETLPNKVYGIKSVLNEHRHLFPIDLGLGNIIDAPNTDKFIQVASDDLYHFNDTHFGIVTETKFAKDDYSIPNRITSDLSLDCFFFSEKTWKFIACKKPFLLAGYPNSLALLRTMGYKTFHPYIDETYDTIEDTEKRLELIADEIERLSNLSDSEILEWEHSVQPIILHNFNVLMNATQTYTSFLPKI